MRTTSVGHKTNAAGIMCCPLTNELQAVCQKYGHLLLQYCFKAHISRINESRINVLAPYVFYKAGYE